jgi:hypothetical protein
LGEALGVEGGWQIGRTAKAYTGFHRGGCGMSFGLEELCDETINECGL